MLILKAMAYKSTLHLEHRSMSETWENSDGLHQVDLWRLGLLSILGEEIH